METTTQQLEYDPSEPKGLRYSWFGLLLAVLGSLILLFVLAPLIRMVLDTSVADLSEAAAAADVRASIRLTLLAALTATVVATVLGVPLAYLLARKRFFGRALLLAIIDLPIIIPHSVAGIALLGVLGRNSWLGRFFSKSLLHTAVATAVAMAFVSMPFLINSAREAFAAVPTRLEKIARTLGASPQRVFFTISLPLAWRGIVSGMILMWARGISEFGAVVIIAYHPMVTSVLIWDRLQKFGLSSARSVAVLLILICVLFFVVLRLVSRAKPRGRGHA